MTFDHFREVPWFDCQCGTACGLKFQRGIGQRSRKFHPDCPEAKRLRALQKNEHARKQYAKTMVCKPRQPKGGRVRLDPREKQKICWGCYNLPHARPSSGCPKCGLPFEASPSLKNHETLKKLPENTEAKWR